MWIIGVWQSNNLSLLTFNHREFTCYDCSSSTSAIWSLHKTFFMWAWDCNALYIPTSFLISCFITLLISYVTCLLLDSGLDVLIWMGMDCSRQTNCSTFTRSSCIGWSAWPKSLCYLRMYYARLLTWLDRRSVLVFSRTHLCLSLVVSSMIMLFLMWLVVFIMSYTESRLHHSARLERLQAFGKCFQYSFQSQQVHCFWKPWPFSYSSGKCVVSLLQPLHWIDTLYWLGSAYKIFFVLGAWESNFDRMGSLCT